MVVSVSEEQLAAGHGYEKLFVPALFAPWTGHLIRAARIRHGEHVLDVACGTGVLARHILLQVGATGKVTGVDPAPGMIGVASELEPGVDWILGKAEALEFEDETFDCLVSQFGMMFFEDCEAAVREMFRVLKPGGRLAIAVWNSIEENPAYREVVSILDKQVGEAAADAVRLPYTMGNFSGITAILTETGFHGIAVKTEQETASFPGARQMVEADIRGWLPLFDIHLEESKIAEVLAESDRALSKYVTDTGKVEFPTSAHVISAYK